MVEQNIETHYWEGNYTEEQLNKERVFVVETVKDSSFIYIGTVTIKMRECYDAMDATWNIKDNMPTDIAKKSASAKFPDVNPRLLMPLGEWKEKYGELPKPGSVVK